MDIISHTLSGLMAATLVVPFASNRVTPKVLMLGCGVIGGFLPDIDTISLWSGFDGTFGAFFKLRANGQEIYFSDYWYSHHSFFHSILSGLLFAIFLFGIFWGCSVLRRKTRGLSEGSAGTVGDNRLCSLALFLGYLAHLAGDLPTPGHTWGGIRLLWPLPFSFGGTGQIWWWNNYDLFLLLVCGSVLNLVIIMLSHYLGKVQFTKLLVPAVVLGVIVLVSYQVNRRPVSFSYSGHGNDFYQHERQATDIQKDILGTDLYRVMQRFDASVPLNF